MTTPPSSGVRARTLRAQILAVLLLGILAPSVVGLWLTRSAVRAGDALLQSLLEESIDRVAASMRDRWEFRHGDLLLLASNESAQRVITQTAVPGDSAYLDALMAQLAPNIATAALSGDGVVRWESTPLTRARAIRRDTTLVRDLDALYRVNVASDAQRGMLRAGVRISALLPSDSLRSLIPGARLALRAQTDSQMLIPLSSELPFPEAGDVLVNGAQWRVVRRAIVEPAVDLMVAAPLEPYTGPFRESARLGVLLMLGVSGAALALAVVLAVRATEPLKRLASAANAVSTGEYGRETRVGGPAEVRQVGDAFNRMTVSLRETLDSLAAKSALAAVGEFTTSLSHDVRNGLTSTRIDLERATAITQADPRYPDLVARALAGIVKLDAVVTGALRVARQRPAAFTPIDVREAVRDASALVAGAFAGRNALLDILLGDAPLIVSGDRGALEQLFANLLFNSAQALHAGGVTRVTAQATANDVVLMLADDGIGIAPEDLVRVRQPFVTGRTDGMGLGLSIADRIASAHGGSLTITSEVGVGTTVRVTFPMSRQR